MIDILLFLISPPSNYAPNNAAQKTVADTRDNRLKFPWQIKSETCNNYSGVKPAAFSQESLILSIKEEDDNHSRQVPTAAPPGLRSSKNRRLLKIIRPSSVCL